MSEKENANPAVAGAQAPVKKKRRGINNDTRSTSQMSFHERDAVPGRNLFIGQLEDVQVNWSNTEGVNAPRLTFHFASNHINPDEQRHYRKSLFSVESSVDTIPNGKDAWKVDALFGFIKHMLQVYYLKGRLFTEEEEDALTLPFEDCDDDNNYIPVSAEDVFNGYGVLFDNVAAMLNGSFKPLADGEVAKPCYRDANGKPIKIWMKLLRCTKRKNEWTNVEKNGDLGMTTFVGSGVIEIFDNKTQVPKILNVDMSKESITPKPVANKTPTVGVPGMGAGVVPGVPQMPAMPMGDTSAFEAAGVETPF